MKAISDFEIEKVREQCRLGKSVIDISKHLGIRKRIVEEILKMPDDTPHPPHTYIKTKIENIQDLKALVVSTIQDLRNKTIEPRISNSVFYGCSLLSDIFKIQEMKDLERRVVGIEKVLKCRA